MDSLASLVALAFPDEGRWIAVPANDSVFEPLDDLLSGFGVLTSQRTRYNDPLHRLCHVEPGARKWSVERHDAMMKEPDHQIGRQMPG